MTTVTTVTTEEAMGVVPGGGSCHLRPPCFRGRYRSDPVARAVYSEAAGIGRIVPAAVAVPEDVDDVVTLVRWAGERSISLVPRGSGTSMAGGAIGPGVVVDLSRMKAIGDVDVASRSIWVGPGALRGDVNRAVSSHGLRFPVDPSSGEYCTIGGMVSTNAAGAHSLKFGAMRDWVLALDCVFADGARATIERGTRLPQGMAAVDRLISEAEPRIRGNAPATLMSHPGVLKESSGYALAAYSKSRDLIELLIGSEGTLAIVVGVKLALAELPDATAGVLGAFSSLDAAVAAAVVAKESGAAACELLDRTFLEIAAGGEQDSAPALAIVPRGTEAVLLTEVESETSNDAASAAESIATMFRSKGATVAVVSTGAAEQFELWELRHAASPILAQLELKSMQFVEDGAVPPAQLAEYVRGVRAALDSRGLRGVIFGHAGDAHVHVNPLIDVTVPGWRDQVDGLLGDIVALTARLGGTLAGEHGDGRLRTPLLSRMWTEEVVETFSLIKRAFDPRGVLNPGVKVPLPGQRAISDIKYDPLLAPLPAEARSALDNLSDTRSYSTLRLSLVPREG